MFKSGLYEKCLLVSSDHLESNDGIEAQYFESSMLEKKFDGQIVFVKSNNNKKEFHQFKMIEITNSNEVKTLYTFIHPKYQESQQFYFNKEADLMIEWLSHNRVLLYNQ